MQNREEKGEWGVCACLQCSSGPVQYHTASFESSRKAGHTGAVIGSGINHWACMLVVIKILMEWLMSHLHAHSYSRFSIAPSRSSSCKIFSGLLHLHNYMHCYSQSLQIIMDPVPDTTLLGTLEEYRPPKMISGFHDLSILFHTLQQLCKHLRMHNHQQYNT